MKKKSNNLRLENAEPPVSPSSAKTNDTTGYMHCDDENLNNEQLSWFPYHSPDEELRNNLRSVIESNMIVDEKLNLIIALCKHAENPYAITINSENPNPYYPPKVWYNYRGDQINPNDVWCNSDKK